MPETAVLTKTNVAGYGIQRIGRRPRLCSSYRAAAGDPDACRYPGHSPPEWRNYTKPH